MRLADVPWGNRQGGLAPSAYVWHAETGERWTVKGLVFDDGEGYKLVPETRPREDDEDWFSYLERVTEKHDAVSLALRLLDFNPMPPSGADRLLVFSPVPRE